MTQSDKAAGTSSGSRNVTSDRWEIALQIVDRLLRSTVGASTVALGQELSSWLGRLVCVDAQFASWSSANLCDSGGWSSVTVWRTQLQLLAKLDLAEPHYRTISQAANSALRLIHLEERFAYCLDNEKLEAIYQLAYGLSHELNNPLTVIASRAGLLMQTSLNPDQRQTLGTIVDQAMRGSEMLGDLMLIARPPELSLSLVDLEALEQKIAQRGQYWTEQRAMHFQLHWEAKGSARLDVSMLTEIVWAILRNAIEASSAGERLLMRTWLEKDEFILTLEDSGVGLSQAALEHCFDPYYCGREAGRGLGMGLAKARRLARLHGGDIQIANRAGPGCRVTVKLSQNIA